MSQILAEYKDGPKKLQREGHTDGIYVQHMKVISLNVSEEAYSEFKEYAGRRGRPVAEVIRDAMDYYIDQRIQSGKRLRRMPTTSKPKLKRRWTKEEMQEELLG